MLCCRCFHDEALCQVHLANHTAVLPSSFVHARNAACLWDDRYGFWYRVVCDATADTLALTMYADSQCTKKAKRASVHLLSAETRGYGGCVPQYQEDGVFLGYCSKYCHSA